MTAKISVIIPTLNAGDSLPACLTALIEGLTPPPPGAAARAEMLARLDSEPAASTAPAASATAAPASSAMPRKLRGLMGDEALEARPWRSAGPGVRMLSLNCGEGNALLLDIAPGHAVPEHSHRGTELTLILKGDYDDSLGHFGCGDVADLDGRIEHQPKAGAQGCLCLAGLDGPLRYKGWLPRLLQPFFPL